ncbi:MAG: hypothetical protein Q9174_006471 [Haloplaca sp. 1 TL-2023]
MVDECKEKRFELLSSSKRSGRRNEDRMPMMRLDPPDPTTGGQRNVDVGHMLIAASRHAASRRTSVRYLSRCHHGALGASWRLPREPAKRVLHVQVYEVPLRKQLKDEAKERKKRKKQTDAGTFGESRSSIDPALLEEWQLTVGLEIHAQLNTEHKLFSDQPAGYQITQYYQPFATNGSVKLQDHDGISSDDGDFVEIGIKQVQLEQDTAKTLQSSPSGAMLDFNRVGHPLIEIITHPQIHSPQTAAACVKKIQALLQAVGAVTTGMEDGGLRADVNVSIRHREDYSVALGQRTEIKNLSSFKAIEDAIVAERNRQISVVEEGGIIDGETRGWKLGASETTKLRGKEGEVDYRYMPDADLGPLLISDHLIEHIAQTLPQLPDETIDDLVQTHGLTLKDAKTLVALDNGDRLDYFDDVCEEYVRLETSFPESKSQNAKKPSVTIANW